MIKMFTWAILAVSVAVAFPAVAQDPSGRGDAGSDSADRGNDDGGSDEIIDMLIAQNDPGTQGPPMSDEELDLTCGAGGWMGTWLEDEYGNPIAGTYEYWCLEEGQ